MSRWRPLTVWQDTRSVWQICFITNCDPRWWFQQVIVHLRWTLQIIIVQSYESVSDLRLRSPGFSGFYSLNLLWTREEPQRVIEIKIKEKRWKKKKPKTKQAGSEIVSVLESETGRPKREEGEGWRVHALRQMWRSHTDPLAMSRQEKKKPTGNLRNAKQRHVNLLSYKHQKKNQNCWKRPQFSLEKLAIKMAVKIKRAIVARV